MVPPPGFCIGWRVGALQGPAGLDRLCPRRSGRRIATFTRLYLRNADERVQFLKGDGTLRTLQDRGTPDRVPQRRDPVLHPLEGTRRQQPRIDHDSHPERL
jgi:hypothetical protein